MAKVIMDRDAFEALLAGLAGTGLVVGYEPSVLVYDASDKAFEAFPVSVVYDLDTLFLAEDDGTCDC